MPRLLIRSEGSKGLALELGSGAYRIGRSLGNDLQINHPSVSTAHCEVTLLSGSLLVRDLGSTNGTFIDRKPIHEACLLFGQVLQVGEVELVLEHPLRISAILPRAQQSGLPDPGALGHSCSGHPGIEAAFSCPKCDLFFCPSCIRQLSRMDGSRIRLCPHCASICDQIARTAEDAIDSAAAGARALQTVSGPALRAGLLPHLAYWLKSKLVHGLVSQRRQMLRAQEMATQQAADLEQRLVDVKSQMQVRIHDYEQRIAELEQELAAAELEKRQLIRNQIMLMKRALAEERAGEQIHNGRRRSFVCADSHFAAHPGADAISPD